MKKKKQTSLNLKFKKINKNSFKKSKDKGQIFKQNLQTSQRFNPKLSRFSQSSSGDLKKDTMLASLTKKIKKIKKFLGNSNKKNLFEKNEIKKRLSFFVFHARYVKVLEQLLVSKTPVFDVFLEKIKVAETHLKDLRVFYFKEQKTFSAFLKRKKNTESRSISLLFKLVKIINVVDVLCSEVQKSFSTKFVGVKAFRLVQKFLDNYCFLYEYWLEFERAGIFNQMISFKNKVRLMRSFWYPRKARRFLREPLWKKVCPDHNFVTDFKCVKRVGFSMSALKLTDELFFWHAFTRKKINQNMWLVRSKKMFRNLSVLRQNKALNKKVVVKMFKMSNRFSLVLNFFKVIKQCFFLAQVQDFLSFQMFFGFFKKSVKIVRVIFIKYIQYLHVIDNFATKLVCFFQQKQNYSLFTFMDVRMNCFFNSFFGYLVVLNFKEFFSLFLNGFFSSKVLPVFYFLKTNYLFIMDDLLKNKNKMIEPFFINIFDTFFGGVLDGSAVGIIPRFSCIVTKLNANGV